MEDRFTFRGWDNENKKWVYGYLTKLQEGARIFWAIIAEEEEGLVRYYIHDKKSIGQCTGLKDKNGKLIYGDDIVYLAGYGRCQVTYPYFELFDAMAENDVEEIIGNKWESPELWEEL